MTHEEILAWTVVLVAFVLGAVIIFGAAAYGREVMKLRHELAVRQRALDSLCTALQNAGVQHRVEMLGGRLRVVMTMPPCRACGAQFVEAPPAGELLQ